MTKVKSNEPLSFQAVGDLVKFKHVVIYGYETEEGTLYTYINTETGETIEGISPPFEEFDNNTEIHMSDYNEMKTFPSLEASLEIIDENTYKATLPKGE